MTREEIRSLPLEQKERKKLIWPAHGEAISRSPVYAALGTAATVKARKTYGSGTLLGGNRSATGGFYANPPSFRVHHDGVLPGMVRCPFRLCGSAREQTGRAAL